MDRRTALKNSALMVGVTLSSSTLMGLLQSCRDQERIAWQPQFFSEEQAAAVSEISDMILPTTKTPGAKDLKVDMFVDLMFERVLSPEDKEHVRKGYERFVALGHDLNGKSFTAMSKEEKTTVLEQVEREANHFNPAVWGSPLGEQPPIDFYRRVKQFTLIGYFTSEEVSNL